MEELGQQLEHVLCKSLLKRALPVHAPLLFSPNNYMYLTRSPRAVASSLDIMYVWLHDVIRRYRALKRLATW